MKHVMMVWVLSLSAAQAWAGVYTGKVTDAITGDPLAGVLVENETGEKTETDRLGEFRLDTEQPRVHLSRLGFEEKWFTLDPVANNIAMNVKGRFEIRAVKVSAKPDAKKAVVSKQKVEKAAITQTTAALFPDVARVVQSLPGVTMDNDMSGLLYVRGGSPDEVVAILDDMIIMNPYLWGGRLSVFNPNLVENVDFYAGGYAAEANQGLSALLDIKNKVGNPNKFTGFLDLSAATADVVLEGPLGLTPGSSFILGLRRTHYDLAIKAFSNEDQVYPYFYDGQAKVTLPNPNGTLSVNTLFSYEGMDFKLSEAQGFGDDHPEDTHFYYLYRRSNTGISYDAKLTPEISVLTLVGARVEDGFFNFSDFYEPMDMNLDQVLLQARHVWQVLIGDQHIVKSGLYTITGQGRAEIDMTTKIPTLNGYAIDHVGKTFTFDWPIMLGLFVQDDMEVIQDALIVNPGFNVQYFSGNQQWVPSPRLSVKWKVLADAELHAATGLFCQHPMESELLDETYGNPDLKAQEAWHYILGAKIDLAEDLMFQVEGFYKNYQNMVVSDADPQINYTNHGDGFAYGADFIVRKKLGGAWDGWLTYSYVTSRRRILERSRPEDFGYNPGLEPVDEWYLAANERPHTVNLVLNYRIAEGWKVALTQKVMTGKPYTPVVGADYQAQIDEYVPRYGAYNSERMPDYTSTDIKITMPFFGLKGWSAYVQGTNLFDVKNVDSYYYNKDFSERKAMYQLARMVIGGVRWEF